jgi:hypothetical protein
MFELKITRGDETARLQLWSPDPNEPAPLIINDGVSDSPLQQFIRRSLDGAYGAFGHPIDLLNVTPIDLHCALKRLDLVCEIVRGSEMVEEYDPGIPEGSIT